MKKEELNEIIVMETKALQKLLETLEVQHALILSDDVFGLEDIVSKISECSKEIAGFEMERRRITQGEAMSKIIDAFGDEELERNYRIIKMLLEEVRVQKDSNELLIRQGLGFTTQLLNILNPNKGASTYNSYGKKKR